MHLEIHKPELEQRVRLQIQSGQFGDVDELLTKALDALEQATATPSPPKTTGEEKARAFVHWAQSHRYTPPLSDEAISRASLYPGRE
jgi:hypothetical protein